jgi:arginase
MQTRINVIGYASDIAANESGSAEGPSKLQQTRAYKRLSKEAFSFNWQTIVKPLTMLADKITVVAELNKRLAKYTQKLVCDQLRFLVIGGDHSSGIDTWSGTQTAIQSHGQLGLIWIDAHMDSHTPETTETGNIHGMPLACLLGYGNQALTTICHKAPKVLPSNLCLIGVRSFEAGEAKLLEQLKVRVYFIEEVKQRGLAVVLHEARQLVTQNTIGYGLSIDLDSIDPLAAPGVNAPVSDGLCKDELIKELAIFNKDTHETVIRLAPPLTITKQQLDETLAKISLVFAKFQSGSEAIGIY